MNEYAVAICAVVIVRAENSEGAKLAAKRALEVGHTDTLDIEEPLFIGEAPKE